jgi:hypothetical protein
MTKSHPELCLSKSTEIRHAPAEAARNTKNVAY